MNQTLINHGNFGQFGPVDYIVFGCLLLVSTAIGLYFGCFSQSIKSTEEYLLGGRKMKTFPIAVSLIASQLSGIAILSVPAEMYTFGSQMWFIVISMIFIVILINYVFVPVFYDNHISNCYEYLESRFGKEIRQIITVIFVIGSYLILPVIMFIPSLAFAQVTGINIHIINGIVSFVCVFYTMLGGIKAVVWTDVVQAVIMVMSLVLVLFIGITGIGGIDRVWEIAEKRGRIIFFETSTDLTMRHTFWNAIFGNFVMWAAYLGLNQSCVQRIVALPSLSAAKRALWIFCIGYIVITSLNCLTGIVMFSKYADCDLLRARVVEKADKLIPFFVQDVVGHLKGMPGVFISCIFSASLSTMSASMNSLAGIVYQDYVKPLNIFNKSDETGNLIMRIIVVLTGFYCIVSGLIVEHFASILQMVITIGSIVQGTTFGVFLMGMIYPWANRKGALAGVISSILVMLYIIVGAQILIYKGELYYEPLPSSIDGCHAMGINVTNIVPNVRPPMDDTFSLQKISFVWYGAIGALVVFIVGIPVSHLTGSVDPKKMSSHLIAPVAHWMLPPEAFVIEVPMSKIDEEKDNGYAQKESKS